MPPFGFTGRRTALIDDGEATVLSRPSMLVLDGRQARIIVGDKVQLPSPWTGAPIAGPLGAAPQNQPARPPR